MIKVFLILAAIVTSLGFRLLLKEHWAVSESSPTLWVRVCPDMLNSGIKDNDVDSGDTLAGLELTVEDAVESMIKDVNDVDHSWIRLAMYPTNPSSPPAPEPGDTAFTLALASVRTIDVCENSSANPFKGGEARPALNGGKIVSCEIELNRKQRKTAKKFLATLTHEIGHCLGLNHPQDTRNAIMSYFHSKDDYRLLIDDKMGLIYLYPDAGLDIKEKPTLGLSCTKD